MRIPVELFDACEKLSAEVADRCEQVASQVSARMAEFADEVGVKCCVRAEADVAADEVRNASEPRWV